MNLADGSQNSYAQPIAGLRQLQQSYLRKAEELESMIVRLREMCATSGPGLGAQTESTGLDTGEVFLVKPGKYATMGTGQAIKAYLSERDANNPGVKITYGRLEQDLRAGGAQVPDFKGGGVSGRIHVLGLAIVQLAKTYKHRPPFVEFSKVKPPQDSLVWLAKTARFAKPPRNQ